jgi:hypothetical protein
MDEVLKSTEEVTGKPVLVREDAALRVHATVRIGRGAAPAHLVLYRPALELEKSYLVVFQCGFLLRLYQMPADKRYDLASAPVGKAEVKRRLHEHFRRRKQKLPDAVVGQFCEQIYNGLMLQLRSVPVGLRVDSWISQNYPVLHEQQRTAAVRQLNENAQALRPEVRELAPLRVYAANIGMNAAFAAFWSRTWADDLITNPYRTAGQLGTGQALLKLFDDTPATPIHDRPLIEAWANHLELNGWFQFIPHN